ncbi:MAG: RHS repeat-associated core domain-containing protein [Ruminococcaceae bacterium]|nr:RHS repeat-associated core domain-containing protein [Oscillospiraceae bacterium]
MELYADPNNLPETFTYKVSKIQNGIETKTTYNNENLPIKVETIIRGETVADDVEYAHEDITYDAYELPVKRDKYVGEYIESTEQFEYDSLGNLLKHWSVYADGEKNNEYVTSYTYDSTYNLPLTTTYKRDADTTVTEIYTLSSDKKTISQKEVKENDTLKERTVYTYDTYGNIIKERKYKNATQYIDVNYDYTDTTGADRPNNTSFNGAYLTKIWQNGGNDIDGNAIGNVEYKYEYDNSGNRIKETDPLGNTTQYQYDDFRRITKITNPSGGIQTLSYTVNTTANTTTHTDELGTQTKYIYDPANNLTDVLDVTSGESLESYDYDKWYRKIKERNVQLLTSGFETTYAYDSLNRVTSKETKDYYDVTVAKENYAYDDGVASAYLLTTHTIVGDSFAPSIITKEYVNAYGDVEKIGYVTGNNEYFTTYKYDYLGTKTEELAAIADQKDWTNTFTSKWEYDYAGRVLREYDASNNFISYEYDWLGRPIKAYDRVSNASANPYYTSYTYDNLGNVIQETIPQTETTNKVTKYKYDKLGNLTLEKKLYDIVDGEEIYHSTSYSYDWRGNVITATQDIYPTTYTYDALGRCLTTTTGGKTTTYTYDRFGNVLTETFGGKTNTYEYDMNMFRTKHTYPSGKRITYEPNALQKTYAIMSSEESGGRTFEYTMTGSLLQASDATYIGRIRRKYDDRGNIIEEENTGMTKTYTYDISGKRESMLARSGSTTVQNLTYTYNNLEQTTAIKNNGYNKVAYEYDANGQVAKNRRFGAFTLDMDYTYNRDGTTASVLRTEDYAFELYTMEYEYTYYSDGNLKTDIEPYKPTKTYTYNSRNMLESESLSIGKTTTYAYDANGNRSYMRETQDGASGTKITNYSYDARNQMVTMNVDEANGVWSVQDTYIYDDDGNLTQINHYNPYTSEESTDTFAYNGYGEMSRSIVDGVVTNYTYYADGLRRSKTTNGVTTYHMLDGDDVIADLNGSYELTDLYLRGIAGQLEMYEDDSAEWSYIAPIHGDVRELLAMGNGVATTYTYDAFGNHTETDWHDLDNPFRYSGEYYDEETGFIYLRARYYDPTIGRFISEDPIRDGLNWYAYCNNNPVMYVDPSGLERVFMWTDIFASYPEETFSEVMKYILGVKKENVLKDKKTYLSEEECIMVCTVYGEAANCSIESWMAIANVIENRVGQREWKKYKSAEAVIKKTGFDAYTSKNTPYRQAEEYLKNRDGTNKHIEKCIGIVLGVHRGILPDNTNGAVLYYSPKAQEKLYGRRPSWDFSQLIEVEVAGGENDDLKFYKYK